MGQKHKPFREFRTPFPLRDIPENPRSNVRACAAGDGAICSKSNGNRTEWSPIQSVIIRVITKSDDRAAGVRFVYHEYDYRLNWTTRSPIIN